jgi:hypothetical protein
MSWSVLILATLSISGRPTVAASLDALLADASPDIKKWASVVIVTGPRDDPQFDWHHYRNSAEAVDFWPASTIKVYTVVAALEFLNELKVDLDCVLAFEHKKDGEWVLDAARTMRELIHEVFRRSSNEDYTLLLRFVGIDRINTRFLIPEKGFPHSALMRDYVIGRPYDYERPETQRVTVRDQKGKVVTVEHTWSGVSFAEQRGATVISKTTGNCTSTREMAECLRRIMFHEHLPPAERYELTDEQLAFVRHGGGGLVGLENKAAGPYAWTDAAETVYPDARYFHKGGMISTYTLDLAYIDDEQTGIRFILAVAAESGKSATVKEMARRIAEWVRLRQGLPVTSKPAVPTATASD